ncbi:hypothetical protein FQR65_LT14187 [Abscondita terminalis]|nr:hypothetical protein FQR65_LT14187 [Abscondita terminalis]
MHRWYRLLTRWGQSWSLVTKWESGCGYTGALTPSQQIWHVAQLFCVKTDYGSNPKGKRDIALKDLPQLNKILKELKEELAGIKTKPMAVNEALIQTLKTKITSLKKDLSELKLKSNSKSNIETSASAFDVESICQEVSDRKRRSRNIIIFNAPESNALR